jgi:hypothetical protein
MCVCVCACCYKGTRCMNATCAHTYTYTCALACMHDKICMHTCGNCTLWSPLCERLTDVWHAYCTDIMCYAEICQSLSLQCSAMCAVKHVVIRNKTNTEYLSKQQVIRVILAGLLEHTWRRPYCAWTMCGTFLKGISSVSAGVIAGEGLPHNKKSDPVSAYPMCREGCWTICAFAVSIVVEDTHTHTHTHTWEHTLPSDFTHLLCLPFCWWYICFCVWGFYALHLA